MNSFFKYLSTMLLAFVLLAGCGAAADEEAPSAARPTAGLTPRPTVAAGNSTAIPTNIPQPTAIATNIPPTMAPEHALVFSAPQPGAAITSPVLVAGNATLMPFEGALVVEIHDARGGVLASVPIIARGEYGGPADWSAEISFAPPAEDQAGAIVVYEPSAEEDAIIASASLPVQLKGSGAPAGPAITLDAPAGDIASPVRISGSANYTPFEKNFAAAVYDSEGNLLGQAGIQAEGEYGGPSTFAGEIEFTAPATARPGKIVVYEASAKDGSTVAEAAAVVRLAAHAGGGAHIALPAHNARVTLPLHAEAAGVAAFTSYGLRLVYADGTVLEGGASAPATASGVANLAANLDWATESAPPNPPSQPARLELIDRTGAVLATREIVVMSHDDPGVMPIKVYFTIGEQLQEVTRYVPRSPAVATAALRELSWGPAGNELAAAGMDSALPRPETIIDWPFFKDGWASRTYLQSISINDGLATIDWSPEFAAWGGGSARLHMIGQQVRATLGQFPTIKDWSMTVDGSTDALQP